jgi:hypothetical protein
MRLPQMQSNIAMPTSHPATTIEFSKCSQRSLYEFIASALHILEYMRRCLTFRKTIREGKGGYDEEDSDDDHCHQKNAM